jgi:hypothetical protein
MGVVQASSATLPKIAASGPSSRPKQDVRPAPGEAETVKIKLQRVGPGQEAEQGIQAGIKSLPQGQVRLAL